MNEVKLFNKKDIEKATIKWWQKLYLWFLPIKEQWTNEGWVVRYKEFRGQIYIVKIGQY